MYLNLGSGTVKLNGYVNIDNRQECAPDLVCDVSEGLPFPTNSIDCVRAWDFLEHIPIGKTVFVMEEIWRVLKPDGLFNILVPSTDGRGAWQDPYHVSFWNQNSFLYFMDNDYRNLYNIQANFQGIVKTVESAPGLKMWHVKAILKAVK